VATTRSAAGGAGDRARAQEEASRPRHRTSGRPL
jgi:hypothetical protein